MRSHRLNRLERRFIAFILWGVGAFVGTMLAGKVLAMSETTNAAGETVHDWANIWPVPAWLSLGVLVVFFVFRTLNGSGSTNHESARIYC